MFSFTRTGSALGLVLFGVSLTATAQAPRPVSQQLAKELMATFYDALNDPGTKDIVRLVTQTTTADWQSCGGNDRDCVGRDVVINGFKRRAAVVPDLKWGITDISIAGDMVTVRGEATGTPIAEFLGVPAKGKSFRLMYISVHQLREGKIARSYHVEDYAGAARQLTAN
jgi:steroid delta-isomerase-like uncharacterized protein